ncbi:MAG: 30S ribosomal protein S8 [Patescibacteria group bacterium]
MMDPIADMLTRIRNASAVRKEEVVLPMSKIKFNIAKILETNGWVGKVEEVKAGKEGSAFNQIRIVLKYDKDGNSVIKSIKRVSKPGLKIYKGKNELPKVLNNFGIAVISTSQGLMTNKEAAKKGVGGEIICEVY